MENEKTRTKSYYQANKEKLLRRSHEYYRNLPEDEKIKSRNCANSTNKYMSDTVQKEKKNL